MPFHRSCALVLLVVVLAAAPSLAQNRYFPDRANGVTLQGGWVAAEEADGFGGAAVLTFNGRFDIGVGYAAPRMDMASGYTQDWTEITPRMAIALIRPRPHMPVGVDLAASYTSVKFGGTLSDLVGGSAQTIGLDVSGRFGGDPRVQLLPAFGIHWRMAEAWVREQVGDPKRTMETDGVMIGVEIALLIQERFFVIPGTTAFDGDTTWSITAGFALEMK